MKWLKHLFPSLKEVTPRVVHDCPEWTLQDAASLEHFLETVAGNKLLERMRYDLTCVVLDPSEMNLSMRNEWRAIAYVLAGIESMANTEYWKYRDKEYLESEYGTGFMPDGTGL